MCKSSRVLRDLHSVSSARSAFFVYLSIIPPCVRTLTQNAHRTPCTARRTTATHGTTKDRHRRRHHHHPFRTLAQHLDRCFGGVASQPAQKVSKLGAVVHTSTQAHMHTANRPARSPIHQPRACTQPRKATQTRTCAESGGHEHEHTQRAMGLLGLGRTRSQSRSRHCQPH